MRWSGSLLVAAAVVGVPPLAAAPASADPADLAPGPAMVQEQLARLPAALDVAGPRYGPDASVAADAPSPVPPPTTPRPAEGVTVVGERPTGAVPGGARHGPGWSPTGRREDERVGPYGQPEWTTDRRWARVRSYVIAPWQVEFESWMRARYGRHGQGDKYLFQEEVGVGLPYRFQLDVYANFQDDMEESFHYLETQFEVRWALADWDCLWWNPTLYFEYRVPEDRKDPDALEGKLLLSDDLAPRWVGGVNLTYERELGGEEEEVLGATAGVSYSLIDQRLYLGAEVQYERATVEGGRGDPEHTVYLGPSVSIRTGRRTHLDVAPLFGLNDDANVLQLFVVFGIDLGPGGGEGGGFDPVAARSR